MFQQEPDDLGVGPGPHRNVDYPQQANIALHRHVGTVFQQQLDDPRVRLAGLTFN